MNVYCVIGDHRAAKSLSPLMHNHAFRKRAMDCVYVGFCVDPRDIEAAVIGLRGLGVSGANVTVPHKESIAKFMDHLSAQASALGAVNTIVRHGDQLVGHNTDVQGFSDSLKMLDFKPRGSSALVFGSGGAARAVVKALIDEGAESVIVAGRNPLRINELTESVGGTPVSLAETASVAYNVDLVVNATTVSTFAESSEMSAMILGLHNWERLSLVLDINYGRENSFWEELAIRNGSRFSDGLIMLAGQAVRSFEIWTGERPPVDEFLNCLRSTQ
jgi:shikimate dehydrogenase